MIPEGFKEIAKQYFTSDEEFQTFFESMTNPVGKSLKIINSFISEKEFEEYARNNDWTLSKTQFWSLFDDVRFIDRENIEIALWKSIMHLIWFFYLQEVAASFSVHTLLDSLQENNMILDMSSAPGWKSIQLADAMMSKFPNKPWCIISDDVDRKRLIALQTNIERIWLHNITTTLMQWQNFWKYYPEFFDIVLLDAPCSGEWTCFKSKDALENWRLSEIKKIAWLQWELLQSALMSCKIGWTIVYSTCTINTLENEENIQRMLDKYWDAVEIENIEIPNISRGVKNNYEWWITNYELDKLCRLWPHIQKTWWFFVCKIRKLKSVVNYEWWIVNYNKIDIKKHQKKGFWNKKLTKDVINYFRDERWINDYDKNIEFFEFNKTIFATTDKTLEYVDVMHPKSVWVSILKRTREWFRPLHNFWKLFWKNITQIDKAIGLDNEQMQKYAEHGDLKLIKIEEWKMKNGNRFVVVKWNWFFCSVGKIVWDVLKNKFIDW